VLVGKTVGNGFPVAGVVVDRRYDIPPETLPGSTYSGNPLAAATVLATLEEMRASDLSPKIGRIAEMVEESLGELRETGIGVRGKGAFWILEFPTTVQAGAVTGRVFDKGVIVSPTANFIRLFPAATISLDHLEQACDVIRQACRAESGTRR
jgi:4-aminobutyrate aminotransferase-like enzyme